MHVQQQAGLILAEPFGADTPSDDPGDDDVQARGGAAWPTLLDLLGGPAIVESIVDRLVARLMHDPLVSSALDGVDVPLLKREQARFFTEAFSVVRAHRPLMLPTVLVDSDQFTRVLLAIHDTLVSLALPQPLTEQLMLAVLARCLDGDGGDRQRR